MSLFRLMILLMLCTSPLLPAQVAQADQSAAKPPAIQVDFRLDSGDPQLERNKSNVLAFYDMMFNQSKPALAMELYSGAEYIQHNPEVGDGKAAFIAFFEKLAIDYPDKSALFKRIFAEGSYVTLHGEHRFPGWRGGSWAAIDIFRLDDNGKVVEHWDVIQKVPSSSANSNGMF
ncbi:MAG: nuclear transport factor 2 family protein [Burkholderiaceae bacterium]